MLTLLFFRGGSLAGAALATTGLGVRRRRVRPNYDHENRIVNEYLDRLEAARDRPRTPRPRLADAPLEQIRYKPVLGQQLQAKVDAAAARRARLALDDDDFLMLLD